MRVCVRVCVTVCAVHTHGSQWAGGAALCCETCSDQFLQPQGSARLVQLGVCALTLFPHHVGGTSAASLSPRHFLEEEPDKFYGKVGNHSEGQLVIRALTTTFRKAG